MNSVALDQAGVGPQSLAGSNNDAPKVTVVIPVYNTAPFLRQCLDSVAAQTLQDIEIICVDDGSTDDSLAILNDYAAQDSRFKVLQQANQYAGVARNKAMEQARGSYLVFWDSDDFFELEALEKMYEQITRFNADICVCGASQYFEETGETKASNRYLAEDRLPQEPVFNRHTHNDFILTFTTVMVWNKMYRRVFIEEVGLKFQPRRNANDTYFSACALLLADRIVTVKDLLVTYRIGRSGSLVDTLGKSPLAPVQAWADVRRDMVCLEGFPEFDYFFKVVSVLRHTWHQLGSREKSSVAKQIRDKKLLSKAGVTGRSVAFYASFARWFAERKKRKTP